MIIPTTYQKVPGQYGLAQIRSIHETTERETTDMTPFNNKYLENARTVETVTMVRAV